MYMMSVWRLRVVNIDIAAGNDTINLLKCLFDVCIICDSFGNKDSSMGKEILGVHSVYSLTLQADCIGLYLLSRIVLVLSPVSPVSCDDARDRARLSQKINLRFF